MIAPMASPEAIHASTLDFAILAFYFLVVLGIGGVARLTIKTDVDFFLSGGSTSTSGPELRC